MIKKGFKTFVIDDYLKIILKIISNEFKSLHSGSKHLLLHEKPAHLRSTTALLAKRWSHIASLRAGTSAVEKTDLRKAIVAGVRVYLCRLFSFVVYGAGCRHWSLGHTREALCCRVVSSVLGQLWEDFAVRSQGIFVRSFAIVTVFGNPWTMGLNSCPPFLWKPRLCTRVSLGFVSAWK